MLFAFAALALLPAASATVPPIYLPRPDDRVQYPIAAYRAALDYSLISDEAGRGGFKSFTGAFVVACHDVSGRRQPADFEFFDYVERGQ